MNRKSLSQTFFIYLGIFIAGLFLVLWIKDYSGLRIPATMPGTEIRMYPVLMVALFLIVTYLFQRKIARLKSEITILQLTISSVCLALASLLIFQVARHELILEDGFFPDLSHHLYSILVVTSVYAILALSVAFDTKKVRGVIRHLPTIIFLLLIYFGRQYLSGVEW